ncbi:MAG TPA: hypothetical protein VJ696_03420, partial [Rhodanobacteraceae bacterium]|nr:hypothetical protein [Rhodanobacteraceae bacterium]
MRNPVWCAAASAVLPLLVSSAFAATGSPAGEGIGLTVGLGTDTSDGACGADTTLSVTRGDQVNYCYTVTNDTAATLTYHTLADDVDGTLFTDAPATIAPGATYQYNRIVTATDPVAPVSTWTAYDAHPGYAWTDNDGDPDAIFTDGFEGGTQYAFVDITTTGTNLALFDDDYIITDIGFPFTFYGQTADHITVSNNGGLLFDQGARGRIGYLSPVNRTLPDRMIGPAILPFWDDIQQDYIDQIGNVYVDTQGEAPNRRFIVEWFNLPVSFGGFETVTFEAILVEGSNDIVFQYADIICGTAHCDDGASATIGLNSDRTHATLYSFDETTVADGKAIRFHPTSPATYTATAEVTLDVGAPAITVDPASFDKTAAAGASTTDTLTIGNAGNRDLTWNIGSVGARSHFPPVSRFALPVGDPTKVDTDVRPVAPGAQRHAPHPLAPLAPQGIQAYADDLLNVSLVNFDANDP